MDIIEIIEGLKSIKTNIESLYEAMIIDNAIDILYELIGKE